MGYVKFVHNVHLCYSTVALDYGAYYTTVIRPVCGIETTNRILFRLAAGAALVLSPQPGTNPGWTNKDSSLYSHLQRYALLAVWISFCQIQTIKDSSLNTTSTVVPYWWSGSTYFKEQLWYSGLQWRITLAVWIGVHWLRINNNDYPSSSTTTTTRPRSTTMWIQVVLSSWNPEIHNSICICDFTTIREFFNQQQR